MSGDEAAIEIQGLEKRYGDLVALHGIDLTVEPGAFFGLLGPNGAGKTTTINILSGLVNRSGGSCRVFGYDGEKDYRECRRRIGLVPQEFNFDIFGKVHKVLEYQGGYFGIPAERCRERANVLMKQFDLYDKRDVRTRMLSGGMKRRLLIARALMHEPELLILDEPTAGVDVDLRRQLWEFLREINRKGTTVLLTTHYIEEAELLCDTIGIIDRGRIIAQDSTLSMSNRLAHESVLITTLDPVGASALATLDDLDPKVDKNGYELMLTFNKELMPYEDMLKRTLDAGIRVGSIKPAENRLEQVFLHLTGKRGRIMSRVFDTVAFMTLLRKEVHRFFRMPNQTLFPPLITSSLYILIFGYSIGSRIVDIGSVTYMQFMIPGLIMMSVINGAFSSTSGSVFSMRFQNSIHELMVSSMSHFEIVLAIVLGGVVRGTVVGTLVALVSMLLTDLPLLHLGSMVFFAFFVALIFASFGFISALWATDFDKLSVFQTYLLTPLIYLGGVFFSVDMLPAFWQKVALCNPILYFVNGLRYGFLGITDVNLTGAVAFALGTAVLMFGACFQLFRTGWNIKS